jgi:hypothetical protein
MREAVCVAQDALLQGPFLRAGWLCWICALVRLLVFLKDSVMPCDGVLGLDADEWGDFQA